MSSRNQAYGTLETRRRILQAAWELIEERGGGITLADAAERAGVSRQAVYLHFGDRTGLILGLVQYMDETIGLEERVARVFAAPTGAEAVQRLMAVHRSFNPKIDPVARVLDAAQYQDEALATAWRDRLEVRRGHHRMIAQRLADEGQLAEGWTVEEAGDLIFAITLPAVWRELIRNLGWAPDKAADAMARLVLGALTAG